MPSSTIQVSDYGPLTSATDKWGLQINPNFEIKEIQVEIDGSQTRLQLYKSSDKSLIAETDITSNSATLTGLSLSADTNYELMADANGNSYSYLSEYGVVPKTSEYGDGIVSTYYVSSDSRWGHDSDFWVTFTSITFVADTPQNLSTTVTSDGITVQWDSIDWDGLEGHYDIFRGTASGSLTQLSQISSGTTTYTDTQISDGEKYWYAISATNSNGVSVQSAEVVATKSLPSPTLESVSAGSREVSVTYSLPDNSSDGDVTIELSLDGGSTWPHSKTISDLSVGEVSFTRLLDGRDYTARVTRSTDHVSSESGTSTVQTDMPPLSGLSVESVDGDQATLSARDNANNKQGYRAYVGPDGYLEFDRADSDYVEGPEVGVSGDQSFTFFAEFELTSPPNSDTLFHWGNSGAGNQNFGLRVRGDDGYRFYFWSNDLDVGGGPSPVNSRVTVAAVYDAENDNRFVWSEGSILGSDSPSDPNFPNRPYAIGRRQDRSTEPLDGNIYRAVGVPRALSTTELDELAAGGNVSDAIFEYHFNQGSGSTVEDYSGNGNDGTLVNSPTWHGGGPLVQDGDLSPEWSLRDLGIDVGVEADVTQAIQDAINGDSFTIGFWFDPYDTLNGDSWNDFISFPCPSGRARFEENNSLEDTASWFWPSTDWDGNSNLGDIHTTEPVHVALTYGGDDEFATLQDGEVVKSGTEGLEGVESGMFNVGSVGNGPFGVDDLFISSEELSPSEVRDAMDGEDVPSQVLRWRCNDGPGSDTVTDQMGEEDGAIVGGVTWHSAPLAPVRYTTTNLRDGERYITRMSVYTEDTEVYDQ